jgi:hypothetical protein
VAKKPRTKKAIATTTPEKAPAKGAGSFRDATGIDDEHALQRLVWQLALVGYDRQASPDELLEQFDASNR